MGTNYYAKKLCKYCGNNVKYHIGKKSYGWVFLFEGTQFKTVTEWIEAIIDNGMIIEDEYGEQLTLYDFLSMVDESYQTNDNIRRSQLVHGDNLVDDNIYMDNMFEFSSDVFC